MKTITLLTMLMVGVAGSSLASYPYRFMYFEKGKTKLTKDHKNYLDTAIVRALMDDRTARVGIQGHSYKNESKAKSDSLLVAERLYQIRDYLCSQGIEPDRVYLYNFQSCDMSWVPFENDKGEGTTSRAEFRFSDPNEEFDNEPHYTYFEEC